MKLECLVKYVVVLIFMDVCLDVVMILQNIFFYDIKIEFNVFIILNINLILKVSNQIFMIWLNIVIYLNKLLMVIFDENEIVVI